MYIGLSTRERVELSTYKLKDVAQERYVQCRNNRTLRGCSLTWKIIKMAYLDRFFLREMREEKVVEFINLRQGGRSVHDYSLEFIKLSKYAPFMVSDPRDQMSHFVMGVPEDLQDECQSIMLHYNMKIYLKVYP